MGPYKLVVNNNEIHVSLGKYIVLTTKYHYWIYYFFISCWNRKRSMYTDTLSFTNSRCDDLKPQLSRDLFGVINRTTFRVSRYTWQSMEAKWNSYIRKEYSNLLRACFTEIFARAKTGEIYGWDNDICPYRRISFSHFPKIERSNIIEQEVKTKQKNKVQE